MDIALKCFPVRAAAAPEYAGPFSCQDNYSEHRAAPLPGINVVLCSKREPEENKRSITCECAHSFFDIVKSQPWKAHHEAIDKYGSNSSRYG